MLPALFSFQEKIIAHFAHSSLLRARFVDASVFRREGACA